MTNNTVPDDEVREIAARAAERWAETLRLLGEGPPRSFSRWHSTKAYGCTHDQCENEATSLNTVNKAHNCCGHHKEITND